MFPNMRVAIFTINRTAEGKILESTEIWDGLGLMKQFGIELRIECEMLAAGQYQEDVCIPFGIPIL